MASISLKQWQAPTGKSRTDKGDALGAALARRTPTGPLTKPDNGERLTADGKIPGLDVAQLMQKYGAHTANTPRRVTGTFRVPIDATTDQLNRAKLSAIKRLIGMMEIDGWEFRPEYRIQVLPGRYPAHDLVSGMFVPDEREILVKACFTLRKNPVVRVEINPRLLEPITPASHRSNATEE